MTHMYSHQHYRPVLLLMLVLLLFPTGCTKKEFHVETEKQRIMAKYYPRGDIEKIIEKFGELLEEVKTREGEQSPNVIMLNCNLASYSKLMGKYQEAEVYLQAAKKVIDETRLEIPPADDYYYVYGQVEYEQGNYPKAIEYLEEALAIRESNFEEKDQKIGMVHLHLANIYMKLEDYENAEQHGRLALKPFYENQNMSYATRANIILGDIEFIRGEVREAFSYYVEAERRLLHHQDINVPENLFVISEICDKKSKSILAHPEDYSSLGLKYAAYSYAYLLDLPKYLHNREIMDEKKEELFAMWKEYEEMMSGESNEREAFETWLKKRRDEKRY